MGKLHWMHDGKPMSRNFDVLQTVDKKGHLKEEKFVGHIWLANERHVARRVKALEPVRRDRWRAAFMVMFGFWIATFLGWAIR